MLDELYQRLDAEPDAVLFEVKQQLQRETDPARKNELTLLELKILDRQGQFRQTLPRYAALLQHIQNQPVLEMATLEEYGNVALVLSPQQELLQIWSRLFIRATSLQNYEYAINGLNGIGKSFWRTDDYEGAKKYHLQALELALLVKEGRGKAQSYLCLAKDCIALAQFDEALAVLGAGHNTILKYGDPQWHAEAMLYRGMCLLKIQAPSEALHELIAAERLAEQIHFHWALAQIQYAIAEAHDQMQASDAFTQAVNKALDTAIVVHDVPLCERIHLLAYRYHKRQLQLAAAFEHLSAANRYTEEIVADQYNPKLDAPKRLLRRINEKMGLAWLNAMNMALANTLDAQDEEMRRLSGIAYQDALSGMQNRRALELKLADLPAQKNIALFIVDIDHFKSINDNYGHTTGDAVIATLGKILSACCRKADEFIARYGGEEFVGIIIDIDLPTAIRIVNRIHAAIAHYTWAEILNNRPVTASMGLAYSNQHTGQQLLQLADAALYQAKDHGRNCIWLSQAPNWQPEPLHAAK
ncbi:GGDEF domain-containing protein [Chitinibacter bivalviorum]|uniref:diguanylate cyclase n=1 Tax=Chitinibacter bivalviorum TaxID=2739434 RepID=A0A7H9BDZ1_9NEIS|nr:GGDEF domain-containing protein [Chitinibacter bivalviorum]QLG86839.1 GGDEF domain-containing protein [Chitinibacter bivalviorum]